MSKAKSSRRRFLALSLACAAPLRAAESASLKGKTVFILPNFHPASCGWLTDFSKERVYCANSYFDHLDRVRDDPNYYFALSEVNNLIAMMNFQPGRVEELRRRINEKRVELVNGFFLESTINLSGGEALVRLGVEGLRWQRKVFGVRPRLAWIIDVCGTHEQMAQIAAGLGLDAMAYSRKNPTGSAIHWAESPDGTKLLAMSGGHYSDLRSIMAAPKPLDDAGMAGVVKEIAAKLSRTPENAPIVILAGSADYSLAPLAREYPSMFLEQWKRVAPETALRFATPSQFLDAVMPMLRDGRVKIPTLRGGTAYDYFAFWVQCPRVKTWYRKNEQLLAGAEMLATAASLKAGATYPMETFYHAWLQMCLNMDRNTLWGAAGGMVFEHPKSWDARDRFEWVEKHSGEALAGAAKSLVKSGTAMGVFNPLNWRRRDPVVGAAAPGDVAWQILPDGRALWMTDAAPCSISAAAASAQAPSESAKIKLPAIIETKHYSVRLDARTGAIVSLRLKPSGRELIAAPANVIVGEKVFVQRGNQGDHITPRPERYRIHSSSQSEHKVTAWQGALATIVEFEGRFLGGGVCRRTMRFHNDHPRIDFVTELNDVPDRTIVVSEFPLAPSIAEVRRGIPYGFSHGAWERPNANLHGWTTGIVPAVRWSHYEFADGGGLAIFDRGLSGRELNERTPLIYLLNASNKYYGFDNDWLSGKGRNVLEYAIVAHETPWNDARIPHMAWEYNQPPHIVDGCAPAAATSLLDTSANIVVEALRREAGAVEVRFAECMGAAGTAEVELKLPHKGAALTDFNGEHPKPLKGGPRYRIPVRPQQIVTVRFAVSSNVPAPEPLTDWTPLVPAHKRAALREYSDAKGHPPRGY